MGGQQVLENPYEGFKKQNIFTHHRQNLAHGPSDMFFATEITEYYQILSRYKEARAVHVENVLARRARADRRPEGGVRVGGGSRESSPWRGDCWTLIAPLESILPRGWSKSLTTHEDSREREEWFGLAAEILKVCRRRRSPIWRFLKKCPYPPPTETLSLRGRDRKKLKPGKRNMEKARLRGGTIASHLGIVYLCRFPRDMSLR
jgi:hypothetical protein